MEVVLIGPFQDILDPQFFGFLQHLCKQMLFAEITSVRRVLADSCFLQFIHRDDQMGGPNLFRHFFCMFNLTDRMKAGLHCHRIDSAGLSCRLTYKL